MHKRTLIEAIQLQKKVLVQFKKETNGEDVTRKVSPYDVFSQVNAKTKSTEDILLGYADRDISHNPHPVSIYLKNIYRLNLLDEVFNGMEVRRLLKIKDRPNISRNW